MDKIIFNDSFDYGISEPLAFIADDKQVLRKQASAVVDQWGDIDPIPGHSLIHLIALGAGERTGANKNGDYFGSAICKSAHPTFMTKGALYRNHKAHPDKKEGYVAKTAFNEEMGRVELLVAAQHDKCADWLGEIEKGRPVSFSMGFHCSPGDRCSLIECSNIAANRSQYCDHVKKNASLPYGMNRILPDGRKCYVDNPWGHWNDISRVPVGADAIAMDLRKVAALGDDETIGGAELAENFGLISGTANLDKVALLRKLSAIEKRIQALGIRNVKIDPKLDKSTADKLRDKPVNAMFGELAKTGAVLPVQDFFRLVLGAECADHQPAIDKAAALARNCYSRIANDDQAVIDVCSNSTYDPVTPSYPLLDHGDCRKLAADFSPSSEFANERDIHRVLFAAPHDASEASDKQAHYLLDQYAAYKLAALAAQPWLSDQSLFSSLLNS